MEILYTLTVAALCLAAIRYLPFFASTSLSVKWVQGLFILKLLAGIALGLVYTYYYTDRLTADVYKYFDDGRTIYSAFHHDPLDYLRLVTGIDSDAPSLRPYLDDTQHWFKPYDHSMYNDNRTIIRFNALLMLVSGGYFMVHTAVMAFLSFIGTFAIFRFFARRRIAPVSVTATMIFLLPSYLFWTSGLLKEGLLMFGLGIFVHAADRIITQGFTIRHSLMALLCFALLSITKYYVLACILPGIAVMALSRWHPRRIILWTVAVHATMIALLYANSIFPVGVNIIESLICKRNDFVSFAASLPEVGGLVAMDRITASFGLFAAAVPEALFNAFLLPLPWNDISALSMLPLVENLLLFGMLSLAVLRPRWRETDKAVLVLCLSFTLLLYILSGITTPVIGALVRYKTPAMPFLFCMLAGAIDWKRTFFWPTITRLDKLMSK